MIKGEICKSFIYDILVVHTASVFILINGILFLIGGHHTLLNKTHQLAFTRQTR